MKNLIAVFPILLMLIINPGVVDSQRLSLGGRVGLGLGLALFEDGESNGHVAFNVGQQLGALAAYDLTSVFSVQLELSYTQKGWSEGQDGGGRKLTFVELPLLFAVDAPWKAVPNLLFGPSVSYEVRCSVSGIPVVGSVGCNDDRVEWHRKKTQFGILFGLGLGRPFGRGNLDFQLLGDLSLTNLNRETLPPGYTKLLVVSVSATYKIPIGG